jgi:murein DD-endopeptidase MepM/ murein hydrolase activator NlpD
LHAIAGIIRTTQTVTRRKNDWSSDPMRAYPAFLKIVLIASLVSIAAMAIVIVSIPVAASHGPFTISSGIYRVPYADGTSVSANNDHHSHPNAVNRVDLGGGDGSTIVAAASGIIRGIVDRNGNSNGFGDGLAADQITPQDDSLEHSCSDAKDMNGNSIPDSTVKGLCQQHNNYVWIEHANGEWTKYTHFATGSVTMAAPFGNGWQVGDTILVGQPIGFQSDIGSAGGSHLHFEVAAIPSGTPTPPFTQLGGFVNNAWNVVTVVCFTDGDANGDSLYTEDEVYTAGPCVNTAPTAEAGGPYEVNEGSIIQLDGTASSDPHNAILSYTWAPAANLDDATIATPTYIALDDAVDNITLTVSDLGGDVTAVTEMTDDDETTVTVLNVPPTVTATGDSISEAGTATVSATFTDPGTLDTHTASILWGDGSPAQMVSAAALADGVGHVYGDNGSYSVTVTVTDDDGGSGGDTVNVVVGNLPPTVAFDMSGAVAFPGGSYLVVKAGSQLPSSAEGTDPGSDDLTFTWTVGGESIYFNNGSTPDPLPSPFGTFPFHASDGNIAVYAAPGVDLLAVTLKDDDGGSDSDGGHVIVTGIAGSTEGSGWWKHQYSGSGVPQTDALTLSGYLEIVNAVSSVFSENVAAATGAHIHAILSPQGGDRRARARAELMVAWLQFASGAVHWNASVPLGGGTAAKFLPVMFDAEATILNPASTNAQLQDVEQRLLKVRHAF